MTHAISSLEQAWDDSHRNADLHRLYTDPHALPERCLKYAPPDALSPPGEESPHLVLYRHIQLVPDDLVKVASATLQQLVPDLYGLGIHIPSPPVMNLVFLQACDRLPGLEMGASFTMGTTMFLRPRSGDMFRTVVRHEGVHILQRLYPNVFDEYYARVYPGLRIVPRHHVQALFHQNPSLIDNPDCSFTDTTQYAFPSTDTMIVVFYDKTLSTVALDATTGALLPDVIASEYHHPHELIASRMETP